MTCRLRLEFNNEAYPRSCPTCGLMGPCRNGYQQIKMPLGGYYVIDPDGKPKPEDAKRWQTSGIPSQVLIAQGKRQEGATGATGPTPDAPSYTADPTCEPRPDPWTARMMERDAPPRNKVERVPDVLTKLSPKDFAARIEASGGSVGTKLTRVQRAKIADIIEAVAKGGLTDEVSITFWVEQIARILSDED